MNIPSNSVKLEYKLINEFVWPNSSVLDLGCGNGELLALLIRGKKVKAQGIEIDEESIFSCVAKGLSVFHGDIDSGLAEYADKSFHFVILNESLQQVRKPNIVLGEALRVGHKVIVGFPNFAYYPARWQMAVKGKAPVTSSLPYQWYDTPNLHFLSISDFVKYCQNKGIKIEKKVFITGNHQIKILPNLLAETAIFLISR
ncbi:MAG: methionine biosynthesis protein MetW [bacterium]